MGSKIVSRSRSFFPLLITMQTDHKYQNIIIMQNRCFLGHCLRKEMVGRKLGRKINLRRNDWKKRISYIKHWFLGLAQVDRWLNLQPDSFICKFFPLRAGHFPAPPKLDSYFFLDSDFCLNRSLLLQTSLFAWAWGLLCTTRNTLPGGRLRYFCHMLTAWPGCCTFTEWHELGLFSTTVLEELHPDSVLVMTLRLWNCPTASPLPQFQLLFKIMMWI